MRKNHALQEQRFNRVFTDMGHAACLIAAQFVKPFVKSNKNDVLMPRQSAKPLNALRCALYRQKASNNKTSRAFIVFVNSSKPGLRLKPTKSEGCCLNMKLPFQGINHLMKQLPAHKPGRTCRRLALIFSQSPKGFHGRPVFRPIPRINSLSIRRWRNMG